jgi:hypothetical protein
MKNGIAEIIKVNKFTSVDFVCVTYRMGNGEVRVASGKTEAEAMANIDLTPKKLVDFALFWKRSNSGRYFVNNRGVSVEE